MRLYRLLIKMRQPIKIGKQVNKIHTKTRVTQTPTDKHDEQNSRRYIFSLLILVTVHRETIGDHSIVITIDISIVSHTDNPGCLSFISQLVHLRFRIEVLNLKGNSVIRWHLSRPFVNQIPTEPYFDSRSFTAFDF